MSNVYLTNKDGQEPPGMLAAAQAFGSLSVISRGNLRVDDALARLEEASKIIALSNPDDYILVHGNFLFGAYCLNMWLAKHSIARYLIWEDGAFIRHNVQRRGSTMIMEKALDSIQARSRDG